MMGFGGGGGGYGNMFRGMPQISMPNMVFNGGPGGGGPPGGGMGPGGFAGQMPEGMMTPPQFGTPGFDPMANVGSAGGGRSSTPGFGYGDSFRDITGPQWLMMGLGAAGSGVNAYMEHNRYNKEFEEDKRRYDDEVERDRKRRAGFSSNWNRVAGG